jgi:hypothetical protein
MNKQLDEILINDELIDKLMDHPKFQKRISEFILNAIFDKNIVKTFVKKVERKHNRKLKSIQKIIIFFILILYRNI